ncbi:MAG: adenylosuccinate synthase [Candidatus Micrarchaeota archaeon]|nr:adenylosuccinate synthase [Candidatus Micrarchaeota archaeon]
MKKTAGEATVIVGAQFGDEGKGKIIDAMVPEYDAVVRYQGGNNAGHTVVVGSEKFKMHLLPSGVVRKKRSLIAAGVVLDPRVIKQEIDSLAAKGIKVDEHLLGIDFRTQVIFPWHNARDVARETAAGEGKIGTTGRGIGPAYEDRAARTGIRFGEFIDAKTLAAKIASKTAETGAKSGAKTAANEAKKTLGRIYPDSPDAIVPPAEEIAREYSALGAFLKKFACDACLEVNGLLEAGHRVLFEGAQGTLLDNDFGTYPFVTSSHPIAGGACVGAGVSPRAINRIEGVGKAYVTRVGSGPFPTELNDGIGERIREKGAEYGTTTGRPRRVGWLDIPMLRYADYLNGFTGIHLTKLDVLGGINPLKICFEYQLDGGRAGKTKTSVFPMNSGGFGGVGAAEPVYLELPGFPDLPQAEWRKAAAEGVAKGFSALPEKAREYVEKAGELIGVPILSVSVGPERNEIIWAKK